MKLTRPGHTHFKVVSGEKEPPVDDQFVVRLRVEQAKTTDHKALTRAEVTELHGLPFKGKE